VQMKEMVGVLCLLLCVSTGKAPRAPVIPLKKRQRCMGRTGASPLPPPKKLSSFPASRLMLRCLTFPLVTRKRVALRNCMAGLQWQR